MATFSTFLCSYGDPFAGGLGGGNRGCERAESGIARSLCLQDEFRNKPEMTIHRALIWPAFGSRRNAKGATKVKVQHHVGAQSPAWWGLGGTIANKLSCPPTGRQPSDDSGAGVPDRGLRRGDLVGLVTACLWDVQIRVRLSRGSEPRR